MIRAALLWVKVHRLPILLACIAACAYAPAVGWGIPQGAWPELRLWAFDEQLPIGGIQELHHTVTGSPGHSLYYPMFYYVLLAVVEAPHFLKLIMTGQMPKSFENLPPASLVTLTLAGRLLSVFMAAGTVFIAFLIGNMLWDRTRGVLAALFAGLMYPMFYFSRTGNLDASALFWTALSLAVYARMLKFGITLGGCAALAGFAAAAAGTKDGHAAVFVLMPFILVWAHRTSSNRKNEPPVWKIVTVVAVVGTLVYLFTSGFVFSPSRYIDHIKFIGRIGGKGPVYYGKPATPAGYFAAALEFVQSMSINLGTPMLIAAGAGFLLMPRRLRLALLFPAVSYVLFIIAPLRLSLVRYLMPVAFLAVLYASYACGRLFELDRGWRRVGLALVMIICLPLALYDAEITHEMLHDSRHIAAAWIDRYAVAGEPIGYFGPTTGLHPTVAVEFTRLLPFRGTDLAEHFSREQIDAMAETVRTANVNTVLVISSNWTPESPHGTACPAGLYERLRGGSVGFHLAKEIHTPPLMSFITRPRLDDQAVNPPIDVFVRDRAQE